MTRLESELKALDGMTAAELRTRWSELDQSTPPSVATPLLRLLVAHRLQEKREGRLPALVRRELLRLAQGQEDGSGAPAAHQHKLSPGTRLVREWNGQTLLVEVLETGFGYAGREWRSLSEIARYVTGTPWSGPRFFGLRSRSSRA